MSKKEKKQDIVNEEHDRKTDDKPKEKLNDPDLLVGPYKPVEGPQTIKCPHCGEEMPITISTCVNCGHYLKENEKGYVPMDEKKAKKIRWIIGIVCIFIFAIIIVIRSFV